MKRRFGAVLFIAIVVAQVATVAAILISSHQFRRAAQGKETRLELARQGTEMSTTVQDYLRPAEEVLRTTTSLLGRDVVKPEDLIPTLVDVMNQSSQISELSLSMASGSSLTLTRRGGLVLLTVVDAPGGTGESWTRSFDSGGRSIETTDAIPGNFNEWSAADLDNDSQLFRRSAWGDPHITFRSQKLGVSTSQLIVTRAGELTGVARASVDLSSLSGVLGAENLGGGVIFNDGGIVVAHSNPALALTLGALGPEARRVEDIDDGATQVAVAAVLAESESASEGLVTGSDRMVASTTVRAGRADWTIVLFGSPREVLPRTVADNDREARFMQTVGLLAVLLAGCAAYPTTRQLRNLQHYATTDTLTGLANRRSVLHAGKAVLKHGRAGIVVIDVDNFKKVNDTFGHAVGDEVLVEIARRITSNVRRSDYTGRVGGEEFLVVFDLDGPGDLANLAMQIHEAIGTEPFQTEAGVLRVTCSFGIATGDQDSDFSQLLKSADAAMYEAKRAGRDQIVSADASSTSRPDDDREARSRRRADRRPVATR